MKKHAQKTQKLEEVTSPAVFRSIFCESMPEASNVFSSSYFLTRFDTRCISSGMRIQSVVKCHCYLTQKQHTTVMQPSGVVPLSQHTVQKHKAQ
jgi:hypothetical protein